MSALPAIFSLIVGAAGWFYLWHSKSAQGLAAIEAPELNRRRVRLRRYNGVTMLLLAVSFYVAYASADQPGRGMRALLCMAAVVVLLVVMLALALIDIRLTRRLREAIKRKQHDAQRDRQRDTQHDTM